MEKTAPLFYNGIPVGYVKIVQKENRLELCAQCKEIANGLFRAYMSSSVNPKIRLPIGVMMPDENSLNAKRVYTRNDLRDVEIDYKCLDTGELILYKNLKDAADTICWKACVNASSFFADEAIKQALKESVTVLVNSTESPQYFAAPLRNDTAFVFAPAFCLVQVIKIEGKSYGVLAVSEDGMPVKADVFD